MLGLGALTGAGLAIMGLHPTDSTLIDWVLLVLTSVGIVWAAASAPWWALSSVAGVALVLAPPVVPLVAALAVFVLSLGVAVKQHSQPVERAAIAGATMVALSMARELRWFGMNTLVAVLLVVALAGLGLWRRPRSERRVALAILSGIAAVAAAAGLGLAIAGNSARPDLSAGNRTARQGLAQLKSGEFGPAGESFVQAANAFGQADHDLGSLWAQPARIVPIASQHRRAGAELARAATDASETIGRVLPLIDLDSLRIVGGRIDIDAVRSLEAPMAELRSALDELERSMAAAQSGWLLDAIQTRLDDLQVDIDEQQDLSDTALAALHVAPAILGAEDERVYFVMFTTPAEARGQGGFMGNWAELTVHDGRVEMTAFGRPSDLNQAGERPRKLVDAPEDWLARYGQFGYQKGPDKIVGEEPWSNITISAHFPSTALVVDELYSQSGGHRLDGVISLDVFAMERLIGLVGPLELEGAPVTLTGENTAEFLLLDQYLLGDTANRIDLLEEVATQTVDRILSSAPPDPLELGRALVPMVKERRLYAWASHGAEQAVVTSAGLDGALLGDLDGQDGFAINVVNSSGSKIDSFLERSFAFVESNGDESLRIRLTNTSPAQGYPDYVIGNLVGLPTGSSRLWLTVATTRQIDSAQIDGQRFDFETWLEAGLNTYSGFLDLGPGGSSVIEMSLMDTPRSEHHEFVVQPQPLARPELWEVPSANDEENSPTWQAVRTVSDFSLPEAPG